MKLNHKETLIMSASPARYRKPIVRCASALSPFLKHLDTGTLALVMFVALAFSSSRSGKDVDTRESAPAKPTTSEVIVKGGQCTIRDLVSTDTETLETAPGG